MGFGERGEYWVQEDERGVREEDCLHESILVVCAEPLYGQCSSAHRGTSSSISRHWGSTTISTHASRMTDRPAQLERSNIDSSLR